MGNAVIGTDVEQVITIVSREIAPIVKLIVNQSSMKTRKVSTSGGLVTISGRVFDKNVNDFHSYDWSRTDNNIVDLDNVPETLTFDPSSMQAGVYRVRLKVTDSSGLTGESKTHIKVKVEMPVLSSTLDSDNDGIVDSLEGLGDSDGDGIPDYLDPLDQPVNILPILDKQVMQSRPGLSILLGDFAFSGERGSATTSETDISNFGELAAGISALDRNFEKKSDIVDFVIEGIDQQGDQASIVIPLSQPIPADAVYRKFLANRGWVTMLSGNGYLIETALSVNGVCPEINSNNYTAGLIQGNNCLKLTLIDGGEYDGDGISNGRIADPGVIAVEKTVVTTPPVSGGNTPDSTTSGGGGVINIWFLFLLFELWLVVIMSVNHMINRRVFYED